VSLPEIARHLNVDLTELHEMNPALRDPVFRGQKYVPRGYRLRLPTRSDRDWEQLIAQLPQKLYRHNQKRSSIYTVRRGDTAGKIAKTHGVKLNDLIAVNNLDRRATIYVNQNLRIPLSEDKSILVAKLTDTKKNPAAPSAPASAPVPAKHAPQSADNVDPAMRLAAANTNALSFAGREPRPTTAKSAGEIAETQPVKNPPQANQTAEFLLAQGAVSEYQSEQPAAASEIKPPEVEHLISEPGATPLLADIEFDSKEGQSDDVSLQLLPDEQLKSEGQAVALIPAQAQPLEIETEAVADIQAPELVDDQQNAVTLPESRSRPIKQTAHEPQLKPDIMQGHYAVDRVSKQRGINIGFIRVEAEETLGHYAEWLNVSATEIRRLNGFRYGQPLHLSQQIKIPLDRITKDDFEEKRFEFHQELAEDFFATYRVEKVRIYSIKKGDNIWTLSRQEFEVPMWLIKRYNGDVDFGALIPSQKLRIPIIEKNV
jgi:membrane-bound lytic murein transglycosylase D